MQLVALGWQPYAFAISMAVIVPGIVYLACRYFKRTPGRTLKTILALTALLILWSQWPPADSSDIQLQQSLVKSGAPSTHAASSETEATARRIVVMGGTLTEIVHALGAGDRIVGVDRSSLYPPEVRKLPEVGYFRRFSVEGVAALKPDLVIAAADSGPPQAMTALQGLGLRIETFELKPELESLMGRIHELGRLLGHTQEADVLAARIRDQVARATKEPRPARVLVLSKHAGKLQGAGHDTAVDVLLRMLGATNVLADAHRSYKQLSPEAIAALNPDVIITSSMSLAGTDVNRFGAEPGIVATEAARNGRIIVLEDLLLLGFGPRVGEALQQLSEGLVAQ